MVSLLGIKVDEIQKSIKFNYPFAIVLGIIVLSFAAIFHTVSIPAILTVISINLLATAIVDFLTARKVKPWIQAASYIFLSIVIVSTIAYAISFFNPEAMPTALLVFIPPIILQASISYDFGIFVVVLVSFATAVLFVFNFHVLHSSISIANFFFNYVFLVMLGFLASYTMETLRKKEAEIQRIAKLNKTLYQMSKTTSDEVIRNMKEALVVIDSDLKISRYNKAFASLLEKKGDLTSENFENFAQSICLDIRTITGEIIENKIDEAVTIITKDEADNEYQITSSKLILKEDKIGFLVIIDKKQSPWGRVCESKTGKPISLAIVRLIKSSDGKIIDTKVTNNDGHFSFTVPEGEYRLIVSKSGYHFPSRATDGTYHGENFLATSNLVNFNIALDLEEK